MGRKRAEEMGYVFYKDEFVLAVFFTTVTFFCDSKMQSFKLAFVARDFFFQSIGWQHNSFQIKQEVKDASIIAL